MGPQKIAKPEEKTLEKNTFLQPSELGLFRSGRRRAKLTVPAPRRLTLLAGPKNSCAQTIQSKQDML